jgi:hypothetical protein
LFVVGLCTIYLNADPVLSSQSNAFVDHRF